MEGNLNSTWLGSGLELALSALLLDERLVDLAVLNVWMESVDFHVLLVSVVL